MPFGKIHHRNPEIVNISDKIDRSPSALAMKMLNFASLDPEIRKSGRAGLGNASLMDEKVWKEFHEDWESAIENAQKLLNEEFSPDRQSENFASENIISEVKTRRKQDFFRKTILSSYKDVCCISGLNYPALLVASHIKPWSVDKKNRLNPRNGVCLSVLYDKAFDLGLVTITTDYIILVSKKLRKNANDEFSKRNLISIDGKKISLPEKFIPSKEFLEFHNNSIYKG
jgi:predicted restriction endonuclease